MEIFDWIWSQVNMFISVPYIVIFMLISYLVKEHFETFLNKITKIEWKTVFTVLIIAAIVAIPFLLFTNEGWQKIAVTYCVGTSLHEIAFKWIAKKKTE